MMRVILSGCNGHMGRVITDCAAQSKDCSVVCGIDKKQDVQNDYPVYGSAAEVTEAADVLIDFSHPALLPTLLEYALAKKIPVVLCTTGYDKNQVEKITLAAQKIPVFYSGNMSLGINLLIELSKKAAQVLGDSFDIEIIEQHHNQKIDAPSGTALMIADEISSVRENATHYTYDRHSQRKKREPAEIGIHSVRGGTIVGEHEVIFAGPQEVLTLSHSAQSKEIFANGAVNAARFLVKQPAGLYQMSDLLR